MAEGTGLRLKGSVARNGYRELSRRMPSPTGVRSQMRPSVDVCQEGHSMGVIILASDDETERERGRMPQVVTSFPFGHWCNTLICPQHPTKPF